jgi:hypothetical protein
MPVIYSFFIGCLDGIGLIPANLRAIAGALDHDRDRFVVTATPRRQRLINLAPLPMGKDREMS